MLSGSGFSSVTVMLTTPLITFLANHSILQNTLDNYSTETHRPLLGHILPWCTVMLTSAPFSHLTVSPTTTRISESASESSLPKQSSGSSYCIVGPSSGCNVHVSAKQHCWVRVFEAAANYSLPVPASMLATRRSPFLLDSHHLTNRPPTSHRTTHSSTQHLPSLAHCRLPWPPRPCRFGKHNSAE